MEKINETQTRQQDSINEQWMRIWLNVEDQFTQLPTWAQETLFDDINTAINSRIPIFRKYQKIA